MSKEELILRIDRGLINQLVGFAVRNSVGWVKNKPMQVDWGRTVNDDVSCHRLRKNYENVYGICFFQEVHIMVEGHIIAVTDIFSDIFFPETLC